MPLSIPPTDQLILLPLDKLRDLRTKLNAMLHPQAEVKLSREEKDQRYNELIRVECACREALDADTHKRVRRVVYGKGN